MFGPTCGPFESADPIECAILCPIIYPVTIYYLFFQIMAARNRPRNGLTKEEATDAHEERNMWSQIVTDIKRLRTTHAKAAEIAKAQVDMEAKMGKSQ